MENASPGRRGLQGPPGRCSYFTASLRNGTIELALNVTQLLRLKTESRFVLSSKQSRRRYFKNARCGKVTKAVTFCRGPDDLVRVSPRFPLENVTCSGDSRVNGGSVEAVASVSILLYFP